jgi:hypothetical protein
MGYLLLMNLLDVKYAPGTHDPAIGKAVLTGIVLLGLIRKNRIAWQYGRLICFVTAVLVPFLTSRHLEGNAGIIGLVLLVLLVSIPAFAIAISLGRPSARTYFGLACPQCGSVKTKAGDLFFKKIKCKVCGHLWTGDKMGLV